MKWINVIGLIFQFISFWFAAPELLGSSTLKRFESFLHKLIAKAPLIILIAIILSYGLTFFISGIYKAYQSQTTGISKSEMYNYFIILGIGTFLYILLMIFYKRIKTWLDVKFATPLLKNLIENNHARSIALIIGAILFTLGFIMQLVALLLSD